MIKFFVYLLIGLFVFVMFFTPARNYMNNLFLKDKAQLKEEQIIGTVSGYSPRVEEIQRILKDAHFDPGPADGVMGNRTRKAIREFQKEKGLWPNGKVDSKTWLELNREKEALKEEVTAQPLVLPSEKYPRDVKSEEEIARIRLDRNIALKSSDKLTGSGVLKDMPAGTTFSVERLIGLMIYDSDNAVNNIVTNLVGIDYLNSAFKGLGLKNTDLSRKIADYQSRGKGIENYTTAEDMPCY